MLYTVINIVHIDRNMKLMEKLCEQNAEPLHQVVHLVTTGFTRFVENCCILRFVLFRLSFAPLLLCFSYSIRRRK